MKPRSLFVFCLILGMTGFVAAQSRSVTNTNLEQYRQERVKAEQEYRENYARLGMPSPEEIDRRREQSRVEMERLSAQLRNEELQRAVYEAQRHAYDRRTDPYYAAPVVYYPYWNNGNYFWSGWWRTQPIRPPIKHPMPYVQSGYFAGGQFWPVGSRTSAPIRHVPGSRH